MFRNLWRKYSEIVIVIFLWFVCSAISLFGAIASQRRYKTRKHPILHFCKYVQHTATHCNTLQRNATQCNALEHTATHCNTPQHRKTPDSSSISACRVCVIYAPTCLSLMGREFHMRFVLHARCVVRHYACLSTITWRIDIWRNLFVLEGKGKDRANVGIVFEQSIPSRNLCVRVCKRREGHRKVREREHK